MVGEGAHQQDPARSVRVLWSARRGPVPGSTVADANCERLRGGVIACLKPHGSNAVLAAVRVLHAVRQGFVDTQNDVVPNFSSTLQLRLQPPVQRAAAFCCRHGVGGTGARQLRRVTNGC